LSYSDLIHAEDREKVWQKVQEGVDNRESFEVVYRIHHRDGTEKWVWEQGRGVWNENDELEALEGLVLDVSERKRAEEALAQSLDELQRSNRELEEFAYVASHDLQEPLRAVGGCVQVLQRRYKDQLDDRAEELIRHAVEGSGRMQNLINDLLQYSRVGTRGKPLEPTNTNRVLDDVMRSIRPVIEESGAEIHRDELPQVMADSSQLGQVFQNLITNALKFRGEGTPEITIGAQHHTGEEGHAPEWVFHVRDNGIGIAPEYSERIFVMFQRLHTRAEYPGTGIGLAICKKIIERHGGRIWLESEVGQGTTFFFSLPDVPESKLPESKLQDGDL
jgi:light-regulated signal transduction histidine kinase (bacteriophytochrome)